MVFLFLLIVLSIQAMRSECCWIHEHLQRIISFSGQLHKPHALMEQFQQLPNLMTCFLMLILVFSPLRKWLEQNLYQVFFLKFSFINASTYYFIYQIITGRQPSLGLYENYKTEWNLPIISNIKETKSHTLGDTIIKKIINPLLGFYSIDYSEKEKGGWGKTWLTMPFYNSCVMSKKIGWTKMQWAIWVEAIYLSEKSKDIKGC